MTKTQQFPPKLLESAKVWHLPLTFLTYVFEDFLFILSEKQSDRDACNSLSRESRLTIPHTGSRATFHCFPWHMSRNEVEPALKWDASSQAAAPFTTPQNTDRPFPQQSLSHCAKWLIWQLQIWKRKNERAFQSSGSPPKCLQHTAGGWARARSRSSTQAQLCSTTIHKVS